MERGTASRTLEKLRAGVPAPPDANGPSVRDGQASLEPLWSWAHELCRAHRDTAAQAAAELLASASPDPHAAAWRVAFAGACGGCLAAVEWALANGADPNATPSIRMHLLFVACYYKDKQLIDFLVSHGASLEATSTYTSDTGEAKSVTNTAMCSYAGVSGTRRPKPPPPASHGALAPGATPGSLSPRSPSSGLVKPPALVPPSARPPPLVPPSALPQGSQGQRSPKAAAPGEVTTATERAQVAWLASRRSPASVYDALFDRRRRHHHASADRDKEDEKDMPCFREALHELVCEETVSATLASDMGSVASMSPAAAAAPQADSGDVTCFQAGKRLDVVVCVSAASGLVVPDGSVPDPHVEVSIGSQVQLKTGKAKRTRNPRWEQTWLSNVESHDHVVTFTCMHGSQVIVQCKLDLMTLPYNRMQRLILPLDKPDNGVLHVAIRYEAAN
eukprot:m51a1_g11699 hypothetical protein (448) ;mRNA; r:34870-36477